MDRPNDESERIVSQRQPLRAIVKDLIKGNTPLNEKSLCKVLKDLIKIRKLGVHPQDVRLRNYGGELLLNFGIAIKKPHLCWNRRSRHGNVL